MTIPFQYVAGGTLSADNPSYIPRRADTELYNALKQSEYCYVLTSRQMGKSSLIVRATQRLRQENIKVVALELTKLAVSNATIAQWYYGLLDIIGKQLGLRAELVAFWKANDELDCLYRWMQALQQVVLSRCAEPVVICLDEIDSVLSLPFSTDEFFASIRECFNARTSDLALKRLTFCFIGVATPSELIQNERTTPFNIGRRIDLTDFTEDEVKPLVKGLQRDETLGRRLLQRIWYWTNGHPYLTQKLCQAVAEDKTVMRPAGVDRACEELFFASRSRESEDNLQYVRKMMLAKNHDHAAILDLYQQVWRQKRIKDDDKNPIINVLRLAGVVRVWENYLWVRNQIYYRVFDEAWVLASMQDVEKRQQRTVDTGQYRHNLYKGAQDFKMWGATGGTLPLDAPSYIERRADTDLYHALQQGQYCYILTGRQMGKSSLIVRTAQRLRQENVKVVLLDLTRLGSSNITVAQWYHGLLYIIGEQLGLRAELVAFWKANDELDYLYRWMQALQQVVLSQCAEPVVIFLDEIDSVLYLPFSADDFFAGIRECFNARTQDSQLQRLTFCLIGIATPSELIQDVRITPFNIGRRIDLTDFTEKETMLLLPGLQRDEKQGRSLLQRIWYWTNGHPYLTQKLGQAVADDKTVTRPADVDRVCEELFFSSRAREIDFNLHFVDRMVLAKNHDHATVLDLYRQLRQRKRVKDDDTNPIINALRLAGLIRVVENYLKVRNRVYFQAFDEAWILANMPDAEKRRQKDAYRRGVIRTTVVASAIIAAFSGGTYWYYYGFVKEHIAYYKSYAKYNGISVGSGQELMIDQVRKRPTSFKFFRQGYYNPVRKVQVVNSKDECTTRHGVGTYFTETSSLSPRECQWEFVLDSDGKIAYEKSFDKDGNLVWGMVYSPLLGGKSRRAYFVGSDGYPRRYPNSNADLIEFEYSAEGQETSWRYFDFNGTRQLGYSGAFRLARQHDSHGNTVRMALFDTNEQPILHKEEGWHKWIAQFDEQGNQTEAKYFGTDGQPILDNNGIHKVTIEYDALGNGTEWAYFGTDNRPILHKEGYHRLTHKYDDRSNLIEEAYFNVTEQPIFNNNGIHKFTFKNDERGNMIEMFSFDVAGQPILDKNGVHRVTFRYDALSNRVVEWAYFNVGDQPILLKNGYHKFTHKYDDQGNVTEEAYFDVMGRPILLEESYQKIVLKYDVGNKEIERTYLDTFDNLVKRLDDRGNVLEQAYFGTDGQPILDENGIHRWTSLYDTHNNEIERAFFGTDDLPILSGEGLHKVTFRYNAQGKEVERAFFGTDGKPILLKDGNHKWIAKHDERGNEIERAFFGTNGQPILDKNGIHKWTSLYDTHNNEIERAFFGINDLPTLSGEGLHKVTFRHNAQGKEVERAFFGIDGKPILLMDGNHKWTAKHDERGNEIERAFFGTDGLPILLKDGYHKWTAQYDAQGNEIKRTYFDIEGNPLTMKVSVVSVFPDSQGEKLGIQAGDIFTHYDGKPVTDISSFIAGRTDEPADGPAKALKILRDGEELTFMVKPGKIGAELTNQVK